MGDIMGKRENNGYMLRESTGRYSLAVLYGIHSPLDRMLVTANGNLQRLFASYYDTEVAVVVLKCSCRCRRPQSSSDANTARSSSLCLPTIWDRTVELRLLPKQTSPRSTTTKSTTALSETSSVLLCTAVSEITIRSVAAADAIASGRVGIGQWFRHGNILPTFELHGAGYSSNDNFHQNDQSAAALWRLYTLDSDDMQCRIREDFVAGVWDL
jgi:hypothetical protein